MFLTETATRHSILMKHKHFRDKVPKRLQSNSSKLMGETREEPIDVDNAPQIPALLREEDDEVHLENVPSIQEKESGSALRRKRHRDGTEESGSDFEPSEAEAGDDAEVQEIIDSDSESAPPTKRARQNTLLGDDEEPDDKKKMAIDISYEGFAIYGMVLCLVVKKRDTSAGIGRTGRTGPATSSSTHPTGQAMMENWISSTQVPLGMEDEPETGR